MKQVRETNAGQAISAYVILNKKRQEVAHVHAYYSDGGVCYVDVWNIHPHSKTKTDGPQQAKAGGYGYDKFTAALRGLEIDGIKLNDHCGQDERSQRLLKQYEKHMLEINATSTPVEREEYWRKKVAKLGMRFANVKQVTNQAGDTFYIYSSLYYESGLDKLKLLGYDIICAI